MNENQKKLNFSDKSEEELKKEEDFLSFFLEDNKTAIKKVNKKKYLKNKGKWK